MDNRLSAVWIHRCTQDLNTKIFTYLALKEVLHNLFFNIKEHFRLLSNVEQKIQTINNKYDLKSNCYDIAVKKVPNYTM